MYFVQFQETMTRKWDASKRALVECEPYVVDATGSEGVFILDGRNSIYTMRADAKERAYRLRLIHNFTHAKIMKGKISCAVCLDSFPLKV